MWFKLNNKEKPFKLARFNLFLASSLIEIVVTFEVLCVVHLINNHH